MYGHSIQDLCLAMRLHTFSGCGYIVWIRRALFSDFGLSYAVQQLAADTVLASC